MDSHLNEENPLTTDERMTTWTLPGSNSHRPIPAIKVASLKVGDRVQKTGRDGEAVVREVAEIHYRRHAPRVWWTDNSMVEASHPAKPGDGWILPGYTFAAVGE